MSSTAVAPVPDCRSNSMARPTTAADLTTSVSTAQTPRQPAIVRSLPTGRNEEFLTLHVCSNSLMKTGPRLSRQLPH
jgi:hypothetical protein